MAALVVLAFSIVAGWMYIKRGADEAKTDTESGCLASGEVPQAALFMVDATDRLSPETAHRVIDKIRGQAERLPPHSRMIVLPFGGDTATPSVEAAVKILSHACAARIRYGLEKSVSGGFGLA